MALRQPSPLKAPRIQTSNATSNSLYYASNKEFSVSLGERNTNKPVIEYSLPAGNKVSFSFRDIKGKQVAPEAKDNSVTFKEVSPNIDLKYTTLPRGLKEEIVLKKQVTNHLFTFNLNATKAYPQVQTDTLFSSTFYDKKGNYLFHFEKPFALDAKGSRTDNVSVQIRKDTKTDSYSMTLNVDRDWLESKDRTYPIVIDPTIIHDTNSVFATGQFNRTKTLENRTTSLYALATGGNITFKDGYAIHTFPNGAGTFTATGNMNVEVLVVAGGGGGGSTFGGGGGGGGVLYNSSYAVTTTPISVSVGTGGAVDTNGNNSVFGTMTAIGGGHGGSSNNCSVIIGSTSGGSGGGGGYNGAGSGGTAGQGNAGGSGPGCSSPYPSGGGGGAGGAGGSGSGGVSGSGGAGVSYSISGTATYYGGGGGGDGWYATPGTGGAGFGQNGGGTSVSFAGGGGGGASAGATQGVGGAGTVIVRYLAGQNPIGATLTTIESYFQELRTDPFTVGLWHFNELSGNALDSSGNGNSGTPTGTTITEGLLGKARNFNGTSDYISTGSLIGFSTGNQKFTIEAWIKPTAIPTTRQWPVQLGGASTNNFQWLWNTNGTLTGDNYGIGSCSVTPSVGIWSHFATVYDGSRIYCYLNGNFVSMFNSPSISFSTTVLNIAKVQISEAYFSGSIDEMRISNIARSAEEIRLDASRRPYSTYTSDVLDLTKVFTWNSFKWDAFGLATGDGETATASATSNIVAQWNFNETSGTTAISGGTCGTACNGTLTSFASTASQDQAPGTGWTAANRRWGAGALMFDGVDDYISVSNQASLNPSSITVETWFNPSKSSQTVWSTLVSKTYDASWTVKRQYQLGFDGSSPSKLMFQIDGNNDGTWTAAINTNPISAGQWYHVVGTYNGSVLNLFVNGVLVKSVATTEGIYSSDSVLHIGSMKYNGGGYWYSGTIDSTRIYSRALTASEIASNYNSSRIEFQTRVGNTANPNDGTWEAWRNITGETQIDSMDTNLNTWKLDFTQSADSLISKKNTSATSVGTGNDGACNVTGVFNINTQSCVGRANADGISYSLSAPIGGGNISYANGKVIHSFITNGNLDVPAGQGRNVEYLVVGGGGGGGTQVGGGGGAGGFKTGTGYAITSSTVYPIIIGAGGAGSTASTSPGSTGGSSTFGTITSNGGGGGGSHQANNGATTGGSGGGGGGGISGSVAGAAGMAGQGNTGGNGIYGGPWSGGGGGGAGAVGSNSSTTIGGNGGIGVVSSISGVATYYAGGGGGCSDSSQTTLSNGGLGGGGGGWSTSTFNKTYNGTPNTGGGGGGVRDYPSSNGPAGSGGSGIVIVSYPYTLYPITAGDTSITMPMSPTGLAAGDEFMIINQQGLRNNNKSVGEYETHIISSIVGNTIYFTDYSLKNSYDVTTQKIILQRIPNYTNVTVGRSPSGNNGSTSLLAGYSCLDLKNSGVNTDGAYWIDPDGAGGNSPIQAYCNMTYDGGGWTMAVKTWYQAGAMGVTGALGAVADATTLKGNPYKLADSTVRDIIGPGQNFDVLADQNGWNSAYSTGNFEYVVLRNFTGYWRFDVAMADSVTETMFQSYRISDGALAATFNLKCGHEGGAGINCYPVLYNNPGGGLGCNIYMGSSNNAGWHNFFMSQYNSDTYLYVCNGAQHSSSYNLNHRFWIREKQSAAITASAWDGAKGGIVAFRANGTVTVNNGAITTVGLGYRGGAALGANSSTGPRPMAGESFTGPQTNQLGIAGNGGGGGSSYLASGGAGGSYGSPGTNGISCNSAHETSKGVIGTMSGQNTLIDRMLMGSGGGAGGDGYNNSVWGQTTTYNGNGGNGGGIIFIGANAFTVNPTGKIDSNGVGGTGGWFNTAVSWISGGAGGGGAGGSIALQGNTFNINNQTINALGGQSQAPYYGAFGATNGGYVNNPYGGNGGVGRISILYNNLLSGMSLPTANTNKPLNKTMIEGTDSLQLQTGVIQNGGASGFWHFGQYAPTKTYTYTGSDQTYTVPAGVTSINVKMWGGGGGGGAPGSWTYGYPGGGGGYISATMTVVPGQNLTVMVGAGGTNGSVTNTSANYGGGGRSCGGSDCIYGGQGGGRSAIRIAGTDYITAGGGGGGGTTQTIISKMSGGAGGGTTALDGWANAYTLSRGRGATPSSGGAGGTGNQRSGTAGIQYQGGQPGGSESYGGSGGGGWFGGGGGGYDSSAGNIMAGGGGGSSYYGGAGVSAATTTAGFERLPGNLTDLDAGAGYGGFPSTNGTPGKVIITANSLPTVLDELDSSGNRNNAVLFGTTLVDGISGKARSFNGTSDYIEIAHTPSINITKDVTVSMWINPTTTPTGTVDILSKHNSVPYTGYLLESSGASNSYYFGWGNGSGWECLGTTSTITPGIWQHVAFSKSGKVLTHYVNGVPTATCTGSTENVNINFNSLYIGRFQTGGRFFNGKIDELKVENIGHSAEEIAEYYRNGRDFRISKTIPTLDLTSINKLPFYIASDRLGTFSQFTVGESAFANYEPDANTVALWHLDEQAGSGAFLLDSIGSNHGAPTNTTFAQGKIGKSRYFNGSSSFVEIPDSDVLDITNNFTLDAWLYRTADNGTWERIISKSDSSGYDYWLQISTTDSLNCGLNADNYNQYLVTGTTTIPLNTWTHVACSLDASNNWSLYVNGARDTISSTSGTASPARKSNKTLEFGRLGASGAWSYSYTGLLDEVRISNTVRSQDVIRQAYEVGSRIHNITIDFKAKLNSSNLISGSSDLGFTVDETAFGASLAAGNIFPGEKIVVKQTINDVEYIAQGQVNTVNSSTGAITVLSWDTGSTFPTSGFTVDATVFKWQREFFDITAPLTSQKDAITKLSYRVTDGSLGSTIWIDDLKSSTGYLNNPLGSTISSSINNRYFQYRAIFSQNDLSATSSALSTVSLDYTVNEAPNIPVLDAPADTATGQATVTVLRTTGTDNNGDALKYKIVLCTDSAMTTGCQTFDQTTSTTGWSAASYASGVQAVYTLQTALNIGTIYYWKSSSIDFNGLNVWSSTQTVPFSFTTSQIPSLPTLDSPTNTAISVPVIAILKTTGVDVDGDVLKYKINLCTDSAMTTGCQTFDQTTSTTGWSAASYPSGNQAVYTLQTALVPNTVYYWKSRSIDQTGSNTWSPTQTTPFSFTTNRVPNLPTLNSPINTAISIPLLAVLKTTATDPDSDTLRYKIEVCTNVTMTTGCQTFDQTTSTTGWSAASYPSGNQAVYTLQTQLSSGTVYYWRSYAIDLSGSNTWGSTQTTPFSFTTNNIPNTPTLDSPTNSSSNISTTTIFKTTATDPDSDTLVYKINLCTNSNMTLGCQVYDQSVSTTGWSAASYASGAQATYTVQTNLIIGTTYYWQSFAKDHAGSNAWGTTQSSPYSFTTKSAPPVPAPCTTVKALNNSNITVNWTDTSPNEEYYQLWKVTDGGLPVQLGGNLAANTVQVVDTAVSLNHSYAYLIRGLLYDGANTLYSGWCATSTVRLSIGSLFMEGINLD